MEFSTYKGIQYQLSSLRSQFVAEKKNRILEKAASTMLVDTEINLLSVVFQKTEKRSLGISNNQVINQLERNNVALI